MTANTASNWLTLKFQVEYAGLSKVLANSTGSGRAG